MARLGEAARSQPVSAVQAGYLERRAFPRYVALADGGQQLAGDLDTVVEHRGALARVLGRVVRGRGSRMVPVPQGSCADSGPGMGAVPPHRSSCRSPVLAADIREKDAQGGGGGGDRAAREGGGRRAPGGSRPARVGVRQSCSPAGDRGQVCGGAARRRWSFAAAAGLNGGFNKLRGPAGPTGGTPAFHGAARDDWLHEGTLPHADTRATGTVTETGQLWRVSSPPTKREVERFTAAGWPDRPGPKRVFHAKAKRVDRHSRASSTGDAGAELRLAGGPARQSTCVRTNSALTLEQKRTSHGRGPAGTGKRVGAGGAFPAKVSRRYPPPRRASIEGRSTRTGRDPPAELAPASGDCTSGSMAPRRRPRQELRRPGGTRDGCQVDILGAGDETRAHARQRMLAAPPRRAQELACTSCSAGAYSVQAARRSRGATGTRYSVRRHWGLDLGHEGNLVPAAPPRGRPAAAQRHGRAGPA